MATTIAGASLNMGGVEPYIYSDGGTSFLLSELVTFMQNNNYHVAIFNMKPISSSNNITYGMNMPSYIRPLHFLETMLSTNVGDSNSDTNYPTVKRTADNGQISVRSTFMVELF